MLLFRLLFAFEGGCTAAQPLAAPSVQQHLFSASEPRLGGETQKSRKFRSPFLCSRVCVCVARFPRPRMPTRQHAMAEGRAAALRSVRGGRSPSWRPPLRTFLQAAASLLPLLRSDSEPLPPCFPFLHQGPSQWQPFFCSLRFSSPICRRRKKARGNEDSSPSQLFPALASKAYATARLPQVYSFRTQTAELWAAEFPFV